MLVALKPLLRVFDAVCGRNVLRHYAADAFHCAPSFNASFVSNIERLFWRFWPALLHRYPSLRNTEKVCCPLRSRHVIQDFLILGKFLQAMDTALIEPVI